MVKQGTATSVGLGVQVGLLEKLGWEHSAAAERVPREAVELPWESSRILLDETVGEFIYCC